MVENNEYKFKHYVKNALETNILLKKYIKPVIKRLGEYLPQPRDFILNKLPANSVCCEIGVWRGEFSQRILEKTNPKKLFLVDPWTYFGEGYYYNRDKAEDRFMQEAQDRRYDEVKNKFKKEISNQIVKLVRETSDDAASLFKDHEFDFVYIDGNHSYEYVKKDIINYFRKTKPGGIIAGDDYRMGDVKKAVEEFVKENKIKSLVVKNDQFVITKPL